MVVENTMNQEIEKLINRAPNSEKDKKLRGYIVAKLAFEKYGKIDVAKKYLDLYLDERPQNIPALLLMGDILFSQKSYKDAYFYYTKIYDINSSQKEVLLKICNCLIKCQNMDEEESKKWLNITQEFYGNKDVVRQLKHKINLKSFNNSSINGHIHSNVNDENFYDTFNSITSPIKSEPVDKENFYSPQSPAYHSPIQSPNPHNSLFRLSNLKKDSFAQKEVSKIVSKTPTLPVLKGPPLFRNDSFRSSTNALSSPKLPSSSTTSLLTREIFNSTFGNNSTFKEPEFASSNEKSMMVSSALNLNSTSHITTTVPKSLANETFNNGGNIIINVITPNPQQHQQQQPSNIDDGKQSSVTDALDSKKSIENTNVKTEKTLQQSLLISTFEKSITTAMQEMTQHIQRLTENFEKTLTSNTDMIKNMVETNAKTLQTQSLLTAAVKANDELLKDILVQLNNLALSQQSTHAQIDMLRTQPLSHRYFPNNLINMNTNTPIDYNQMQQSMLMWQNQHFQTPQPLPGLYNPNLLYDQANNYLPNNINNVIWSSHLNPNINSSKDANISNFPPSLPQTTINIIPDFQPIKHTSTIDFNFGNTSLPITTSSMSSSTKIITNKTSNSSCHHNNSKLSFAYPSTGGGFGGSKSAVLTPTLKGHSFSESHDLDENDVDESLQQLEDEQLSLAKLPAFSFKPFNEIKVSSPSDLKATTKSLEKPQQLISSAKTFNLNNFEQLQNQNLQKIHSSEELNESDTSDEYSQTSETTNNESSTPDEQTYLNKSNQIFTAPILKQPTWFCEVCYCENSCDANKCLACESVRKVIVNPVLNQSSTNVTEQPLEMDIKTEHDGKNTSLLSNKSLVSEMPSKFSFAFTLPVPTVKTPLSDNKVSSFSFDLPSKVEKIPKSPLETSHTVDEGGEGEGDESINDSMVNYNNPVTPPFKMEREEKGQHVIFAERAKLYRYDTETKEWKERGLGLLKILQEMPPTEKASKLGPNKLGPNAKPGKKRIILRRDHIYKLACNHYIPNHAKLIPFGNHTTNVNSSEARLDKTKDEGFTRYSWYALDFAHPDALEEGKDTSKGRNEFFTAKFKTPQIAQQFKDIFENDLETKTVVNSDEDEITIVYDNMPAPELVSKAQSLKMSPFFYSYLEKKEPHDILSSTPDNSNAAFKTEPKCMTCESLSDESHIDNANNGELLKSEGVKKEILSTDKEITPEKNETISPITATNKMIHSDKNGYLIDVSTQEYILFDERAKIYRFDSTEKAWKERGLGQMLVLAHPSNPAQNSYAADNDEGEILRNIIESTRLLFRREQVLKLACNHRIDSTLKLVPGPSTENKNKLSSDGPTSYTWRALDFSSEDIVGTSLTLANGIEEKFTVRFKTSDQAKRFFDCVEACKIGKYPKPLTTKDLPQIMSAIKSNTPEIKPEHVETNDENDEDTINIKSQEITPPLIASSHKLNVCENNLTNFSKLFPTPAVKENEKTDKNLTNLVGKMIDTSIEKPFTLDNLKISIPSSSSTITSQNALFSIPNTSILSGLSDKTSSIFSIPSTTLTSNSSTLSFPKISFNFSTTLMTPNVTNSNALNNVITGNKEQPLSLDNKATSNIVSTSNSSLFGFGFNSGANTLSFAQLATNVTSTNNAPDGKLEETQSFQKASSISTEKNPENDKTFGFQGGFGFGSNNTSSGFSFATLAASNAKTVVGDDTKKESDEIKPFWGSSTADNTKWTFGSSTNINPSLLTPKPLFASQNNSIQKSLSHTPVDNEEGGSGAEDSNDTLAAYDKTNEIINAPIVELVNIVTGEENETPIFNERAKLYRFDNNTKEWKERAVGQFKILKSTTSSSDNTPSYRILMRREIIHKVACNHRITPTLKFEPFKSDAKGTSLTWQCMDYSEEPEFGSPPGRIETFTVRFKNVQMVQQFLECVTKCQNEM